MAEFLLAVMFVAATLYAVLGGADFGVGLVEAFVPPHDRERVEVALAPVWEANHVWLVLIAVLAFVGFPPLYTVTCTYLHIPLMLVLLGIVARGSAFTFRHYDPDPGSLRSVYSVVFRAGSFLTPLFLGVIVATTASGTMIETPTSGFYAAFVAPWNTLFAWTTGLFVCCLFAFEGAALLAAEYGLQKQPLPYLKLARVLHVSAIMVGGLVLLTGYLGSVPFARDMLEHPFSLTALLLATAFIPLVARAFRQGRPWLLRLSTGAQVALVLAGFGTAQFPVLLRMASRDITLSEASAPAATLRGLTIAVCVGLALIVPATVYLLRVYKTKQA